MFEAQDGPPSVRDEVLSRKGEQSVYGNTCVLGTRKLDEVQGREREQVDDLPTLYIDYSEALTRGKSNASPLLRRDKDVGRCHNVPPGTSSGCRVKDRPLFT